MWTAPNRSLHGTTETHNKHTSPLIYFVGALVTFLKACMNIYKTIAPRCLRMSPRNLSICPLSTKSLWTDNVGLFHKGKNKDGTISCLRLLLIVDQKVPPKLLTSLNDLLHLAHLCGFSPLWIMMCFLRVPALLNDFLHWAQCAASLQCGSEGDSSDSDICWMTLSIEHMCASSFHCELWGDFWDFQLDWMTFCIQNRCAVFLHCESWCACSEFQLHWMTFRIQYICVAPLHCDDASDVQLYWKTQCIQHIYAASLHCESRGALSEFQLCWIIWCIWCMCVISLHCELIGVASDF